MITSPNPFSPRELLARIKAVLRRTSTTVENEQIIVNELILDPAEHRVTVLDEEVQIEADWISFAAFFHDSPRASL